MTLSRLRRQFLRFAEAEVARAGDLSLPTTLQKGAMSNAHPAAAE